MISGGTSAPTSPAKKPVIAPKPSLLKSPPVPRKLSHGSTRYPVPMPKPRKLQATQSSPAPLSSGQGPGGVGVGGPPPVKTKTFKSSAEGHRANSEDSGVFDMRDSVELSKAELNNEVPASILEEPTAGATSQPGCMRSQANSPDEDAAVPASLAKRWPPSIPKGQPPPPKPLPRRAPPSPVPPPRRARSVVDPPCLSRELKSKLNRSTEELASCHIEEEADADLRDSLNDDRVQAELAAEDRVNASDRNAAAYAPPLVPPHKDASPLRCPMGLVVASKPSRPPPPPKHMPPAPPIRPKPTSRKIQSQLIPDSHSILAGSITASQSGNPKEEGSPEVPPRKRRSLTIEEELQPNQSTKSIPSDQVNVETGSQFRFFGASSQDTESYAPLHNFNNGSLSEEPGLKIPPRKRRSQHASSNSLAPMPYHPLQSASYSSDPSSPLSPEVVLSTSGIVGFHSVAPPRPSESPPTRMAPKPPAPYSPPTKLPAPRHETADCDAVKRTPPPRPPPIRSNLPPKPAMLVHSIAQEQRDHDSEPPSAIITHPESRDGPVSDAHRLRMPGNVVNRNSFLSDDDEYVLPDCPYYENNEFGPAFDPFQSPPLSPTADSAATKRPVPGRQKRGPPPKPKRTPSIQSDISNDGYEDMSRGSLASVALSSIGAEVYSVPRSCEHSLHESGRCQCAEYAEQSSGGEEEGSSDEDSYEKFDQGVLAAKEEEEDEDVEPEVRRRRKAFLVAQELRDSEMVFVDVLKLINEDFKAAIEEAERSAGRSIIEKGTLDQILGHLPQLQMFNECLLDDLNKRVNHWSETPRLADIFLKKGPYLKLYNTYIRDFQKLTATIEDACIKSPLFNAALREFEASPRCQNLAVRHYMLKPIQRIPQYKLLLTEYLKQLDETAQDSDYKDTLAALNIVSEVANHVNESMKQGDNLDKLLQLQQGLVGNHEIVRPGRVFIKEGDLLKLSRKVPQTRRFYLLSDILLYTTPFMLTPGQWNYKLHNVLSLAGMRVSKPTQEDNKFEFSIISVQRSFTLAANTAEERDSWISALNKAITEYASKRSSFAVLHPQYAQLLSEGDTSSLGNKAPAWIPDARVTMCMICTCEFTITWRRHHCRGCGKVICGNCSANKIPLPYLANKVARVCDQCNKALGRGDRQAEEVDESKDRGKGKSKRKKSGKLVIRPSALKQVSANELDTTMSGYLMLRRKKDWKKQWYVLKEKVLYRYKACEDMAALESMPLLGYEIQLLTEPFEGVEAGLVLQLCHQQSKVLFQLRAESKVMAEKWAYLMTDATHL